MRLHERAIVSNLDATRIGRVTRAAVADPIRRADSWLLCENGILPDDPDGYLGVLAIGGAPEVGPLPLAHGLRNLAYLKDGDVVAADPNGFVRTLYRRNSPHNFILVTEQCNSLCLCARSHRKRRTTSTGSASIFASSISSIRRRQSSASPEGSRLCFGTGFSH